MQKMKQRGAHRSYLARREALPGFPKQMQFTSQEEVDEYISKDTICCLLCGKHYKALAAHLVMVHGVYAEDYKTRYNISQEIGLCGCETHSKKKKNGIENWKKYGQAIRAALLSEPRRIT